MEKDTKKIKEKMEEERINEMSYPLLHILISTYKQPTCIEGLEASLHLQTRGSWTSLYIHDGPDEEFYLQQKALGRRYSYIPDFYITDVRYNDFGHTGRDVGLKYLKQKKLAQNYDYVLITNADNYYCPVFVEEMMEVTEKKENVGVVYCDMVHSHYREDSSSKSRYGFFETEFSPCKCDIGAFIVRFDIAKAIGFNHRHNEADAEFIKEILEYQKSHPFNIEKVNKVLFVHN